MNKWQARNERVRQELASDIANTLDAPKRTPEPRPHIGVFFTLLVRREIFAEADTQVQKAK